MTTSIVYDYAAIKQSMRDKGLIDERDEALRHHQDEQARIDRELPQWQQDAIDAMNKDPVIGTDPASPCPPKTKSFKKNPGRLQRKGKVVTPLEQLSEYNLVGLYLEVSDVAGWAAKYYKDAYLREMQRRGIALP